MTLPRLAAMIAAAPFGGIGIFLLWACWQGAHLLALAAVMMLLATAIELAADYP